MSYITVTEVERLLRADFIQYPEDIDEHHEYGQAMVDGRLGGHYVLPFDDVATYATVPRQIEQIMAWFIGASLWDQATTLEGAVEDDQAERWRTEAGEWLAYIISGDMALTTDAGLVIVSISDSGGVRSYPTGLRDKADDDQNVPLFTRAQAGEW